MLEFANKKTRTNAHLYAADRVTSGEREREGVWGGGERESATETEEEERESNWNRNRRRRRRRERERGGKQQNNRPESSVSFFLSFFLLLVTWEVHNTIILSLPPTSRFSVLPLKHWIFVSMVPRGLTMATLGHSLGHRVRSLWSSASPKRSFLCNLWLESLANTINNSVRTRFGLLRNGVSGRSTDSWSKGCGFESWQERREN